LLQVRDYPRNGAPVRRSTAVEPDDPRSYYSVSRRIVAETPNSILADQYHNPMNPGAHYRTTGPEIWEQSGGQVKVFVTGMGTGGIIKLHRGEGA